MFKQNPDQRLSTWAEFRHNLDSSINPLEEVAIFWNDAPFIPHNSKIDPYYQKSWPTPWEIIVDNRYDDLTKAIMMGWTVKLTKKYQNSKVEIQTLVDRNNNLQYNIVNIDDKWVLNYNDNNVCAQELIPSSFFLENLVELKVPR